jgi:hypothetical protein
MPNLQSEANRSLDEAEISLIDVINFLQESWKKLAAAAIVGAVLALLGWLVIGSYTAEYVLLNNSNSNSNSPVPALDIVTLKTLQKSLPNLASQVLDIAKVPESDYSLYKQMQNEEWWQKNIIPTYAISKADAKDLAGISKDLDSASTTILNIDVTVKAFSKEEALRRATVATNFLRTGGAYLQIHSLVNNYENQAISTAAELQQKIAGIQIEMGYQQTRVQQLEELHKRFPANAGASAQVVDPKDSGAKYLPLTTQIIAANNDINQSKEALVRLQKRLAQLTIAKNFIDQASPLIEKNTDGIKLGKELLAIENDLRAKLVAGDTNGQLFLDQLKAQLLIIEARFTKGLEANTAPTASKKGMLKTTAGGLFGGMFLMLLFLLGQKAWRGAKAGVMQ